MKGTPESARIDGEAREVIEKGYAGEKLTWPVFQSALDAYRDAAYWAGYKDAKDEILELQVRGEL